MYETTQTDIGSQFVRIPAVNLRIDSFSQQADPAKKIPRCHRWIHNQTATYKTMQTEVIICRKIICTLKIRK